MYMYNHGTINYTAGVLGILALAVALTALLMVLVLPKEKDGHLPAVFQLIYDLFTPKVLVIEKLLQILYVFLTCLAVLYGIVVFFSGFFTGLGNLVLGLLVLAVGPVLLRVGYELLLLLVVQVKTVREINQKLGGAASPADDPVPPEAPAAPAEPGPQPPVPPVHHHTQPLVHCPDCGTWYREDMPSCPICGTRTPQTPD